MNRTNKYKGKCFLCGASVKAQRGRLLHADQVTGVPTPEGRDWLTLCNSEHCVERVLGQAAVESAKRAEIEADGTIHVPNPGALYPFLKSIGSLEGKRWVASPHRRDRDHVLRVASKLGLKVAPEFATYEDPKPVRDAVTRARAIPTIREYQVTGVRRIAYAGIDDSQDKPCYNRKDILRGLVVADDQGLGKCLQTLFGLRDDEALTVVCNKSALQVWVHEAKKWRPDRFDSFTIIEGSNNFRWPKDSRELVVCNYDILPRTPAQVKDERTHELAKLNGHVAKPESSVKWKRKDIRGLLTQRTRIVRKCRRLTATWVKSRVSTADRHRLFALMIPLAEIEDKIKRVRQTLVRNAKRLKLSEPPCPVLLVGDELHYVENSKAKRTQSWRYLTRFARRVIGLTGTPVESSPNKVMGLLTSARANPFDWPLFKKQFNAFEDRWGGLDFERHPPKPGSTALGAVKVEPGTHELMQRVLIRRLKDDVLPELPPKIFSEIPIELKPSMRKKLDQLSEQYLDRLVLDSGDYLTPFPALSTTLKLLSEACIPTLLDMVESFEATGTPVVVFSPNRPPVEALAKREGWLTSINDLTTLQERFQTGEGFGVAGTQSIAEALTLTRASNVIQVLPFLSRKKNKQAPDRCHRPGQRDTVNVYHLIPDHPLVHHLYGLLAAKDDFVDSLLVHETTPSIAETALQLEDKREWSERVAKAQGTVAVQTSLAPARATSDIDASTSEARAKARALALGIAPVSGADGPVLAARLQATLDCGELSASAETVARWLLPGVAASGPYAVASAKSLLR